MPRIYAYIDQDLKDDVYDIIASRRLQLSRLIQDMLATFVEEETAKEAHFLDPETGEIRHKEAGEKYPERPERKLRPGRPIES